ncbi:hypothetical protein EOM81_11625 [bacterium]|nr:hypothetical protein [bacterium]
MEMIGYHGTNQEFADRIVADGFRCTKTNGWFGPGIYFFEDCPALGFNARNEARGWAISVKKFSNWCVIKSKIVTNSFVDLLEESQRRIFVRIREKLFELHSKNGLSADKFDDSQVYVCMAEESSNTEAIRALVNADSTARDCWSYSVRRPQIQICVLRNEVIECSTKDWMGML